MRRRPRPQRAQALARFMAYVAHVGEGRKASCAARAEVARYLRHAQRRDRRYSLVHGVATGREDYAVMRELDVTLVWSPRSNLALYGETVDIADGLNSGVRIALSTDKHAEEIKCARRVAGRAVLLHVVAVYRNGCAGARIKPGLRRTWCCRRTHRRPRHPAVGGAAGVAGRRAMRHPHGMAPRVCGALSAFDVAGNIRRTCRGIGAGKRCEPAGALRGTELTIVSPQLVTAII